MTLNHEWTRMNVARAFQPEICPLRPAACGLPLRGGGLAGRGSHAKTRRREGNAGVTLNHEWTRMDTNAGRSCFPARDLPSATGCLRTAAAGMGVCRL